MRLDDIARQLRYRIAGDIHRESLRDGDRLPSIRAIATQWQLPPRLVRAAYERLEREGIVVLRPRSGAYVNASWARPNQPASPTREWIVGAMLHARGLGVAPIDFPQWAQDSVSLVQLRCACIESNADQISWLVHEAAADFGLDAVAVDMDQLTPAELAREVRSADIVLSTALHGEMLQSIARREHRPLVLLRLAVRFVDLIAAAVRDGPLFFVVADPRFAARLPIIYRGMKDGENVRVLVAGLDDLGVIPEGAAVYVTRAAGLLHPESLARRTIVSPGRIFSDAMAAELLDVMLEVNSHPRISRHSPVADPDRRDTNAGT